MIAITYHRYVSLCQQHLSLSLYIYIYICICYCSMFSLVLSLSLVLSFVCYVGVIIVMCSIVIISIMIVSTSILSGLGRYTNSILTPYSCSEGYVHIYIYIYIHIYIYIYPPLIRNPPNKKPPPWGEQIFVTINLYGGTIAPLIRNDFWFDLPPS